MSKSTKLVLDGPGITVELDPDEIFPNDPGQGTPVLVCFGGDSGSWNCVTSEGETAGGTRLNDEQREWLLSVTEEVESWMEENGV